MPKMLNPHAKDYVDKLIIEKLENCKLFTDVYGKKFARKRLSINFVQLYTNEKSFSKAGYQDSSDSSITLCYSGMYENILLPYDIEQDSRIQTTILHEGIHAVFTRLLHECNKYYLQYGTGMLQKRKDEPEIGRGFNEGLTNWICKKCGVQTSTYAILTALAHELELAVGEKTVMRLGKGIDSKNLANLGMSKKELYEFLAVADLIYKDKSRQENVSFIHRALLDHKNYDSLPEIDKKTLSDRLNAACKTKEFTDLKKNPEYIAFLQERNAQDTLSSRIAYFEIQEKRAEEEVLQDRVRCESILFTKYFKKEFDEIKNSSDISIEAYKKYSKLSEFMQPLCQSEDLKDMPSLKFQEEVQAFRKRFLSSKIAEAKISMENNQLTLTDLQELLDLASIAPNSPISVDYRRTLLKSLGEILTKTPNSFAFEKLVDILQRSNEMAGINDYSILELQTSEPTEDGKAPKKVSIFLKNGKPKFDYITEVSNIYRKDDEISDKSHIFNFTLTEGKNYSTIVNNFLRIRKSIFAQDPHATITILNDNFIVNTNGNTLYYTLQDEDFVQMEPISRTNINFPKGRRKTDISIYKQSRFSTFLTGIKRKLLVKKSNAVVYDNYKTEQNNPKDDNVTAFDRSLKVNDFNERLKQHKNDVAEIKKENKDDTQR